MSSNRYVLLFSSGRTSAFLTRYFLTSRGFNEKIGVYRNSGKPNYFKHRNKNGDEAIVLMMNTGREMKQSLLFAKKCNQAWDLGMVYLEASINKEKGKRTTHVFKKWHQLSRRGEPFEAMLKKYPLPNNKASNCTRELKLRPKDSFLRDIGWTDAITVVGIRADEAHRKSNNAVEERIIYPLCDEIKVDSKFIRSWWDRQPFDLELKDYEGNCDLCFKKSLKKRLTIVK
ncbi:phosphoadenosine phosphosulfate reductase family protein [Chryseobacterium bernardetii]|uniref:phosphoadenosine phosphosulfate reductase domain-containing protein n=1 Tax=Chryseobacterium bernardetii TaxID=1241978 RepID=UPI00162A175F|nr:phosphoadenosine phosphosulfate reductase family protein [Chryseobacterium bernardetii]